MARIHPLVAYLWLTMQHTPTLSDIQEAQEALQGLAHRTPVVTCAALDHCTGASIYMKCENLQKVGAFKFRGATNALRLTPHADRRAGVATHSSGNHAQAVALTARMFGVPAHIVMPENAPDIKRRAVEGYGAMVYTSGNRIQEREQRLEEVLATTGASFVHPYDDYRVIAGQATAALELLADVPDLDYLLAPIGGGGLLSGTALTAHYKGGGVKVIGAEPALADDAYRSFHSGRLEGNIRIDTIADGLRTQLSQRTLDIITAHVDDVLTVDEQQIVWAMELIWERAKLVVEPSGAVPLAAVLQHSHRFAGKRVGMILSGGNVDLKTLPF